MFSFCRWRAPTINKKGTASSLEPQYTATFGILKDLKKGAFAAKEILHEHRRCQGESKADYCGTLKHESGLLRHSIGVRNPAASSPIVTIEWGIQSEAGLSVDLNTLITRLYAQPSLRVMELALNAGEIAIGKPLGVHI